MIHISSFIARKYFLSRQRKGFINIISILSMLTLAIGAACLFVILSVFNGLSGLVMDVHSTFDADIRIVPASGKTFQLRDIQVSAIKNIEGVGSIAEIIEDDVFLNYKDVQKVIRVKGVSESFVDVNGIKSSVKEGSFKLQSDSTYFMVIGRGIQYDLAINLKDELQAVQLWYPNRTQKVLRESEHSFNRAYAFPSGVFEIERQYDDKYVFIPIKMAEEIFDYAGARTALELNVDQTSNIDQVAESIKNTLGPTYIIETGAQQHKSLYKAIKIEKMIAFIIFILVLAVASINIYLTITMAVISKKKDIAILYMLGATSKQIRNIFLLEGLMIGSIGTALGLLLGVLVCVLQQTFGFYTLDVESAISEAFPIRMELFDLAITGCATFIITTLVSIQPAWKSMRFISVK